MMYIIIARVASKLCKNLYILFKVLRKHLVIHVLWQWHHVMPATFDNDIMWNLSHVTMLWLWELWLTGWQYNELTDIPQSFLCTGPPPPARPESRLHISPVNPPAPTTHKSERIFETETSTQQLYMHWIKLGHKTHRHKGINMDIGGYF